MITRAGHLGTFTGSREPPVWPHCRRVWGLKPCAAGEGHALPNGRSQARRLSPRRLGACYTCRAVLRWQGKAVRPGASTETGRPPRGLAHRGPGPRNACPVPHRFRNPTVALLGLSVPATQHVLRARPPPGFPRVPEEPRGRNRGWTRLFSMELETDPMG